MPAALLIDDEDLAREDLRRLLAAHPAVSVVGEADSLPTARTLLGSATYDLVFLDIDLAGASGFDVVPWVAPTARIVFVTAYSSHALRAFEINALDYLLKPVSAERLARTLARLTAAPPASAPATDDAGDPAEAPLGTLSAGDRVFLKNERGARFVPIHQLSAIISCDNYTDVFVADGSRFLVRRSLKAWENALPADTFARVHRQALVNPGALDRLETPDGSAPSLFLRGMKQPVACSHRLAPDLLRRLGS